MMATRYISVKIDVPFGAANAYLSQPENFPAWAEGLGKSFHHVKSSDWQVDTPMGAMTVRFTPPNDHGVLDHTLIPPEGALMENPMRVFRNDTGCEVVFTLFHRAGQSDAEYEQDAVAITKDLQVLKRILEEDR